jgi:hypothetical protein
LQPLQVNYTIQQQSKRGKQQQKIKGYMAGCRRALQREIDAMRIKLVRFITLMFPVIIVPAVNLKAWSNKNNRRISGMLRKLGSEMALQCWEKFMERLERVR